MKNKKVKLERTNIFLSVEERDFYIAVAEKNEQSLSWILRKVLSNYVEYCNKNKVKNSSTKEINKTLDNISYSEILEEMSNDENIAVVSGKEIIEVKKDEWNDFLGSSN